MSACQSSMMHPFSQERLHEARTHQETLQHFQSKVHASKQQKLKDAKTHVDAIKWMTFPPLPQHALGAGVHQLNMTAKAFQFPFGKSWYKAFRLPQTSKAYRIVVYSYAKNAMAAGNIFYPVFVFIDYAFHITHVVTPSMKDDDPLLMKLRGEVLRDGKSKRDAYVLVATSQELLQSSTDMLSMASTGTDDPYSQYADTGLPNMQYVVHQRAHSPEGSIKVFWEEINNHASP